MAPYYCLYNHFVFSCSLQNKGEKDVGIYRGYQTDFGQNNMLTKEEQAFVEKYKGRIYTEEERSTYEKWSLKLFHNKDLVAEPYLQITLQVDITKALNHFKNKYKSLEGASFTAYLMWYIVQTTKKHPYFRYRRINNEWYIFDDLPIFSPISIGGDARFANLVLDPVIPNTIEAFFKHYRSNLDKLFSDNTFNETSAEVWNNSWFIGNLPNLHFTGFTIHTPAISNGKPYFYFGKRYEQNNKLFNPLLVAFDHSNLDPFVLSLFMEDFQKSIDGE